MAWWARTLLVSLTWLAPTLVTAKCSREQPEMIRLPSPRTSIEPRQYVRNRYINQLTDHTVSADLNFNTSMPSLHLDNFEQIQSVKCSGNVIAVSFIENVSAQDAFIKWKSHSELVVLLSKPHFACNENGGVGTFLVGALFLHGHRIDIEKKQTMERNEVMTDWNLELYHSSVTLQRRDFSLVNSAQELSQEVKEIIADPVIRRMNAFSSSLRRKTDWQYNKSPVYNLTKNIDLATGNVSEPEIEMFDFIEISAYCMECYTIGQVTVKIEMRGSLLDITYYKVSVIGNIRGNLDVDLYVGKFGTNLRL
jgi:hypothetical protein